MELLSRIEALAQSLRANPDVAVTYFRIFPPQPDDLARFEREVGCGLRGDFRTFYECCDGLQLCWTHKKSPFYRPATHDPRPGTELRWQLGGRLCAYRAAMMDAPRFDGAIAINPIAWAIPDAEEVNRYDYQDRTYPLGRFDEYTESNDVALFFPDPAGEPLLVCGSDYSGDYGDSSVLDLRTYLEFLIHTKGLIKERAYLESGTLPRRWEPLRDDPDYFRNQAPLNLTDYSQVYDPSYIGYYSFPFRPRDMFPKVDFAALRGPRLRCSLRLGFMEHKRADGGTLDQCWEALFQQLRARGGTVEEAISDVDQYGGSGEVDFLYYAAGDAAGEPRWQILREALTSAILRIEEAAGFAPSISLRLEPGS